MIHFSAFINIDKDSPEPYYMQVANQLADAIQKGYLKEGLKLPGSRKMAIQLGVHRNTVASSYELLADRGWVSAKSGQGTLVNYNKNSQNALPEGHPVQAGFSFKRWSLLDSPFESIQADILMDDGIPDSRIAHLDSIARLLHINMKRKGTVSKLSFNNHAAQQYFKERLTEYLNQSRGLRVKTDQVLVSRSQELGLYMIAETLLEPGDMVVVGELSYFATNMILQKTGAKMKTVPVDKEGIDVCALEELCKKKSIRMVYLNSHYHYPTTVTLSAERRIKLLELSHQYQFIILEDDYDFEFDYSGKPNLPIAAKDEKGMVIYIGTFGSTMPSAFRPGFIVAPTNLIKEIDKFRQVMDKYGDPIGELALGEMIEDREIQRHLKLILPEYKKRRDFTCTLLAKQLGDRLDFDVPDGGLAIWTTWNKDVNLLKMSKNCLKDGLYIPPYVLYQNQNLRGFRIGFGSLAESEIATAIDIMKNASE